MDYDEQKVADAVLALMCLTFHDEAEYGCRAWKNFDWPVLDRLHEQGFIDDPKNKSKSVWLTAEGMRRSRKLFDELFTKSNESEA